MRSRNRLRRCWPRPKSCAQRATSRAALTVLDQMLDGPPEQHPGLAGTCQRLLSPAKNGQGKGRYRRGAEGDAGQRSGDLSAGRAAGQDKDFKAADATLAKNQGSTRPDPARLFPPGDRQGAAWPAAAGRGSDTPIHCGRSPNDLAATRCWPGSNSPSAAPIVTPIPWPRLSSPVMPTPRLTTCSVAPMRQPAAATMQ